MNLDQLKERVLRVGTRVEDHPEYGLRVKREDLSCREPGPPFSKTRGVFAHMAKLPQGTTVGVLDTYHSQAGHAVAHSGAALGLRVVNYYPEYKRDPGHREPQERAYELGAVLKGLPAGRSAILYHQAKKDLAHWFNQPYMMPNALKLSETVDETAAEVRLLEDIPERVIIPASSATIAAGVIRGFKDIGASPEFIVHMGYSRSHDAVKKYLQGYVGEVDVTLIDEGYGYKDQAKPGETPPWPCNPYYDLKAFRWWKKNQQDLPQATTLFWNVG